MTQHLPKLILLTGVAAFLFGCRSSQPTRAAPRSPAAALAADQANAPLLPDQTLSPGATLPVTRADICVPGYTKKVRNVPVSVKRQVYKEYGIKSHKPGEYEVDHLISLELGGSNSIKNLWPQSYLTQPWNAHVKDALENEMHDEVCSGKTDLATVQHDIATDWIAAYKKYFHTNAPLTNASSLTGQRTGHRNRHPLTEGDAKSPTVQASDGMGLPFPAKTGEQVWVNTKSGKYFHSTSSYYGKTKQGQYMTEVQAKQQGYVAAQGQ